MPENLNGDQPITPQEAEFFLTDREERIKLLENQLKSDGRGRIVGLLNGSKVKIGWVPETNSQAGDENVVGAEGLEPPTLSV